MSNDSVSPAIGRIVHYFDKYGPYDRPGGGSPSVTPKAAVVTHAYGDGRLDLSVLYAGRQRLKQLVSVTPVEGDDKEGHWDWPERP